MASNSNKDLTFKVLFDTRWFFGEISEESAKVILMEASESDGRTVKRMIFLKADGQPNKLCLFFGSLNYSEGKPMFYFGENHINFWCHGNPSCPQFHRNYGYEERSLQITRIVDGEGG